MFKRKEAPAPPKEEPIVEEKSATLNNTLAGIIGNQWRTINFDGMENAYEKHYVIHRAVNLLAQNIAQLPLQIYRGDEVMDGNFRLPGSYSGFDLKNPNERMSIYDLLYISSVYYYYRGEFVLHIKHENNVVYSLNPINPKLLKIESHNEFGYPAWWKFNNKIMIPDEDLIIIPFLNPDAERGLSPIDVVKNELITDDSASEYNKKFFDNFGKIGGMLTDEKGQATREDMTRLVEQFNQNHASPENAYKTLGLPAGIKYNELQQSLREMEFLSGRRDVRDRLLAIYGIHKAVFGVTDQVDRAVADTAMRQLWQLTLKPAVIRIENSLNRRFMKPYFPEYRVKFDLSDVEELKDDQVKKTEQAKLYRELGYSLNEINERFELGMEDVEEPVGNMRLLPQNLVPANDYTLEPSPDPEKASPPAVEKTVDKRTRNTVRKNDRLQRNIEKRMTGKLRNYFSKQLGEVISIVKSNKNVKEINSTDILFAIKAQLEEDKDNLQNFMQPIYEEGSKEATALAQDIIGVSIKPRVNEYVVGQMTNKIRGINDYTYKLIRNEVVASSTAGETLDQLSNRVTNVYKFNASRARRIARTESANLINRSTHEEYQSNGVRQKQWIARIDEDTRSSHRENHNAGIVPFGHVYNNGMKYPGDPNGPASEIVNCRCTLVPIVK